MKIGQAKQADYAELMDLMARAFRVLDPKHPRFEDLLPDLYQATDASIAQNFILSDRGRIVSSVGLFPMDLQMGDVRLTAGGIGGVCTDPKHRGKGYMSALLRRAIGEIVKRGYPVSWLTGDRRRYAHFGWEKAGPDVVLTIDRRRDKSDPGWAICRGRSLDRVLRARRRLVTKGLCDDATYRLKLSRLHMELREATRGRGYAYAVVNTFHKWLAEWGGDPEGVRELVADAAARLGGLSLRLPPLRDGYTDLFLSLATQIGGPWENIAVFDLPALVRAFEPHLARAWPRGTRVRLVMNGVSEVTVAGGRPARPRPSDPALRLDALRMVRLLFGPLKASTVANLPERLKWLDEVLPLPFYVPSLWRV